METKIIFCRKSDVVSYPKETDEVTSVTGKSLTFTGKNGKVTFEQSVVIPIKPMMYVDALAAQGMTINQAIDVMKEHMLLVAGENFLKEFEKIFND